MSDVDTNNNVVQNNNNTTTSRRGRGAMTEEQIQEIISRRQAGEAGTEIARSMGFHATTVYRHLRNAGIGRNTGFGRAKKVSKVNNNVVVDNS